MNPDYAIPFMSIDWIISNSISLLYLVVIMAIGKILDKKGRMKFAYTFVYVFIVMYLIYHIMHIIEGSWSIKNRLPLHLCGFSSLITCFILFVKKKQFLFEILFYAGVLGGFNALLTPLITNYDGVDFFYVEYFDRYIETSMIIKVPHLSTPFGL